MITPDGVDVPVTLDLDTKTINLSIELLDCFPGRLEAFDSLFGHEIAHLIQDAKGEPYTGPAAELEADSVGARLAGRRQTRWAVELLYEFCHQNGLPVDDEANARYPALSERLAIMNEAVADLPPAIGVGLDV